MEPKPQLFPEKARIWIMVLTAPFAFILSYYGYLKYQPEAGGLNAAYHAIQLFVLHSPHNENPLPTMLETGRWLAAITSFMAIVNIVLFIFRKQLEHLRLFRLKNHTILCGLGDIGTALAENFTDMGKLIVVEKNTENENVSVLKKRGVMVITGNAMDPQVLQKARIKKANCLYAVSGNDFTNLTIIKSARSLRNTPEKKNWLCTALGKIKKIFRKTEKEDLTFEIIANIDSLNLKNAVRVENSFCERDCQLVRNLNAFYETASNIKKVADTDEKVALTDQLKTVKNEIRQFDPGNLPVYAEMFQEVKYFDINELSAKYIFRRFPPNRFRNITKITDPGIHLLFLGFSQTGEELLKLCIQNCHFINFSKGKNKTKITLIDVYINILKNKLLTKCPQINELIELEYIQMNPHHLSHSLLEQFKLEDVNIIYIAAASDQFHESYSMKARELFGKNVPLIRWFTKDVISDADAGQHKNIHTLDLFSMVAKDELIRSTDTDKKAIAIHNMWLKKDIKSYVEDVTKKIDSKEEIPEPKPTLAPWRILNEDIRDDNRSVIEHLLVKIRTTGQQMKDEDFENSENVAVDFSFTDKKNPGFKEEFIRQLAEMEHRRWMATKYYYGWTFSEKRNDAKKQHPNLKDFNDLDPEVQQKDIDQIFQIKNIWEIGSKKVES